MTFNILQRYFFTIINLNVTQIFFRIKRNIVKKKFKFYEIKNFKPTFDKSSNKLLKNQKYKKTFLPPDNFSLLNEKENISSFLKIKNKKKLWRYNIYYFDFLNELNKKNFKYQKNLINTWIKEITSGEGLEPYPTSLRIVNWIKWSTLNEYKDVEFINSLYSQLHFLNRNIEYDILGNHIISNAKALIYGGIFFHKHDGSKFLTKGIKIFVESLNNQILNDGGHYERSPMYHSLILEDLLDIYSITYDSKYFKKSDLKLLRYKIIKMLTWLELMIHNDGRVSFFNDSVFGIAKSYKYLLSYAESLSIKPKSQKKNVTVLEESGYFVYLNKKINFKFNIGSVAPREQPGHSHANTLAIEMSIGKDRFIVNSGISTYEVGQTRSKQRSTKAQSTLQINNSNSSDVWSSFRVGRRAKVFGINCETLDEYTTVSGCHDGFFHKYNIIHKREIIIYENKLVVRDYLNRKISNTKIRFYLFPGIKVLKEKNKFKTMDGYFIRANCNGGKILRKKSKWYPEFSIEKENNLLEITMKNQICETIFDWYKK
tara:strand:- start:484 stop:2109 length:1626 start_codon:yes stop_codon:yes gene_type:complete